MKKIEDIFKADEIKGVFIHEVGHFLAEMTNEENSMGTGTEKIIFYPCPENNNCLCGTMTVLNPDNVSIDTKTPVARVPYYVGKLIMGCVFQSYFRGNSLMHCFQTNGNKDASQRMNALSIVSIKLRPRISTLEDKFLEKLKQNRMLDFVTKLNPLDYILFNEEHSYWHLDLEKLINVLDSIKLLEFKTLYLKLVKDIEEIIRADNAN